MVTHPRQMFDCPRFALSASCGQALRTAGGFWHMSKDKLYFTRRGDKNHIKSRDEQGKVEGLAPLTSGCAVSSRQQASICTEGFELTR